MSERFKKYANKKSPAVMSKRPAVRRRSERDPAEREGASGPRRYCQ